MPKVLAFYGPEHHNQLLTPIVRALQARGWEHVPYTANAEAAFEVGLLRHDHLKDFLWLPDFATRPEIEATYEDGCAYFQQMYAEANPVSLLIPPIADRILYEIATDFHGTRRMLEAVKPDVCLALHELNRWGALLGYWSQVKEIPYYTFQEGQYYGQDWIYTGHTRYSTSLVWGAAGARKLFAGGAPAEKVQILGHPDLAARQKWAEGQKEHALASLPETFRDKKVVFVFVTSVTLQHINLDNMLAGLVDAGYRVVMDLHILAALELKNRIKEIFKPAFGTAIHLNEQPLFALPLLSLATAVVVIGCSTLGLEALWWGKPLCEIHAPGQPASFATDYGVAIAVGERPLLAAVQEAEQHWTLTAHRDKVNAFVKDHIAHPNAAEKIADYICGKR